MPKPIQIESTGPDAFRATVTFNCGADVQPTAAVTLNRAELERLMLDADALLNAQEPGTRLDGACPRCGGPITVVDADWAECKTCGDGTFPLSTRVAHP